MPQPDQKWLQAPGIESGSLDHKTPPLTIRPFLAHDVLCPLIFCLMKNVQNPYLLSFIISGCWYKYTFASSSDGLPINLGKDFRPWDSQGNTTSTDLDRLSLTGAADSHSGVYGKFNYV